ncbi:MAG: hypothetical protein WCI38_04545 [Chthoniobacterales bacterium]
MWKPTTIVETSHKNNLLAVLTLTVVAALHGAVLSQYLPLRARFDDEMLFNRMFFGVLIFAVTQVVFLPVWGAFSDRLGRRRMIDYTLVASAAASLLSFAPLLHLQLPQRFIAPLCSGIATAGLVLAVSYSLIPNEQRASTRLLGSILCGFFGGAGSMLLLRFFCSSISPENTSMFSSGILIFVSAWAIVWVHMHLPDVLRTSHAFTGINALQGLWHGFGESNRAARAVWWKMFLGTMGVAGGSFVSTLPLLGRVVSIKQGSYRPVWALVIVVLTAALVSVAVSKWPPAARIARLLAPASAGVAAVAALLAGLVGSPAPAYLASSLAGSAMGLALVVVLRHFYTAANPESAGAELGAVFSIWFAGFFTGLLPALYFFRDINQLTFGLSFCAAIVSFQLCRRAGLPSA